MNLVAPALAASLLVTVADARAEGIAWRTDLDTALREAREASKPVMVDLWATWCAPCKVMEKETYTDPHVIERSRHVVMVKIDVDQQPDVANRFDPEGIPTLVFLDPFGNEIVRREGLVDAQRLGQLLGQLPASFASAPGAMASLATTPDDHAALMAVGGFYADQHAYAAALVYYERSSGTTLAQRDARARTASALAVGTTLLALDAPDKAEQVLRPALKNSDRAQEPLLRLRLADALAAQAKRTEAERAYRDVVKRFPQTEAGAAAAARLASRP